MSGRQLVDILCKQNPKLKVLYTTGDRRYRHLPVSIGSRQDLGLLKHIAANGGPAVQICRASEAAVILKVQLGRGVTLASEGFARTIAIDAMVWKPVEGQNSISTIKALWLESNPKRALLRLVGTARNMVSAGPSEPISFTTGNEQPRGPISAP